jgi:hypothetical protein
MRFRDSASFGKRQEYSVVAELLRRGFDVYMTLVDDQGIDCVVRLDASRYIDIQIKARSVNAKQWNFFAGMNVHPRKNLYYIFYVEKNDSIWIIPSCELPALCVKNIGGKHKGKMSLTLPKAHKTEKARTFEKFKGENGFRLLKKFRT